MNRFTDHILQDPFKRSLLLLILFLIVYETILYMVVGLRQPTWADEHHFISTIEEFGEELSLRQLRTYNEMSPPLHSICIVGKISRFSSAPASVFLTDYCLVHLYFFLYLLFPGVRSN